MNVIPQPSSVEVYEGGVSLAGASFRADETFGEDALEAVKGFESNMAAACGEESGQREGRIIFKRNPRMEAEEYSISVCGKKATAKDSGLNGVLYALETMKHAHTRIQSIHISLVVMAVFIDYVFFSYFCKDHCCPVKVPDDYYKV